VLPQPRHPGEQPLVRALAQCEVQADVLVGEPQALGELRHVVRDQYRLAGRSQRQADVGGADHLAGELAQRLTDLGAEDRAAELAEHAAHRAGQLLRLGGQCAAHGSGDVLGDRVDDRLPDRQGVLHPLGPAPGR